MRYALLALLLAVAPASAQLAPLDLRPGPGSSQPYLLGEAGGRLLFSAFDGAERGLYATDGATVERLAERGAGVRSARLGGALYMFLCDGAFSCDLARTDGTASGTVRVASLPEAVRLGYLAATADRVFFLLGPVGADQTQLWTSDGTASGTRAVEGARPVINDGLRYVVTAAQDRVFFSAFPGGSELWESDGTGAQRAVTFERPRWQGGFFYGSALGQGDQAFALVNEVEPQGLYAVGGGSGQLVAPLRIGTSNRTLVSLGDGVLFGAYASDDVADQPPSPVAFYRATADGAARVTPDLPASDLRNHSLVSQLADGSAALAVGRFGEAEVWRVAPSGDAEFAFRLPEGEAPFSRFGVSDVAQEARPSPAAALVGGVLHVLTSRADGDGSFFGYSLWRDAGDGTARLLASYQSAETNSFPQFATAGPTVYVTFDTPGAGFEVVALGRAATGAPPPSSTDQLAVQIEGAQPARDRARIRVTAPPGERVRVEAFDMLGRRVGVLLDGPAPVEALGMDVSGLAPGVYVVRATSAGGRASVRVVVAR